MFRCIIAALSCLLVLSACGDPNVESSLNERQQLFVERLLPYCGPPDTTVEQRTCDAYEVRRGGAVVHISGLMERQARPFVTQRGNYNRVIQAISNRDSELYEGSEYRIVGYGDSDYDVVRQRFLNQTTY